MTCGRNRAEIDICRWRAEPLPPLDEAAGVRAREILAGLAKPPGSLGRLEDLGADLAAMTGTVPPEAPKKAVVVMAGDHGVVAEGVTPYPSAVTALMVQTFLTGRGAVNVLARQAGAAVICVDVGVAADVAADFGSGPAGVLRREKIRYGTANLARGPAMSRAEAAAAVEVGVRLAAELSDGGYGLLAAGEMGIGNTTASAALLAVLTGAALDQVVGPGTGLDAVGLVRKRAAAARGIEYNRPDPGDALDTLSKIGGLEIAALAGLMVGAARLRRPVIVDGLISAAAAVAADALVPGVRSYLIAGHLSTEPGHAVALKHLELRPYLDLEMRLGEGTGAVMAFHLIDAACRIMAEMATLASLGITADRGD
ncbi:MAG: nicotinate-nucleotide--dimethylbenzimidazole phosphoribosyltransferase [Thermaerobacterales bacterium]